jgi:hypothetical protein
VNQFGWFFLFLIFKYICSILPFPMPLRLHMLYSWIALANSAARLKTTPFLASEPYPIGLHFLAVLPYTI